MVIISFLLLVNYPYGFNLDENLNILKNHLEQRQEHIQEITVKYNLNESQQNYLEYDVNMSSEEIVKFIPNITMEDAQILINYNVYYIITIKNIKSHIHNCNLVNGKVFGIFCFTDNVNFDIIPLIEQFNISNVN